MRYQQDSQSRHSSLLACGVSWAHRALAVFVTTFAVCATPLDEACAQAPGETIPTIVPSEYACEARENLDGFPQGLRFRIVSQDELDARGIDRQQKESDTSRLRRVEFPSQPKTGVFSVSGLLGISGDAKLLVTKDALRLGEIGMVMVVNHSMRDTVIYQCRRITL